MPAPQLEPNQRPAEQVAPTGNYRNRQPVWVWRNGSWRPGVVLSASARAVMVRYRPTDARGTGVDTVIAEDLTVRADVDPLDRRPSGQQ